MSKNIGSKIHTNARSNGKSPTELPVLQEIISRCRCVVNEKFLRLPGVKVKLGFSSSTIWNKVREGTLVPPIRTNPRVVAWRESELNAMIAAHTYASRSGEHIDMHAFVSALIKVDHSIEHIN